MWGSLRLTLIRDDSPYQFTVQILDAVTFINNKQFPNLVCEVDKVVHTDLVRGHKHWLQLLVLFRLLTAPEVFHANLFSFLNGTMIQHHWNLRKYIIQSGLITVLHKHKIKLRVF